MSARAIAVIFRSPPLIVPTYRFSLLRSAGKIASTSSIRAIRSALPSKYPPMLRFSLTFSGSKTSSTCGT